MLLQKKINSKFSIFLIFLFFSGVFFENSKFVNAFPLIKQMEELDVKVGEGYLSFFGFKFYKAELFSNSSFDKKNIFSNKFALQIKYYKGFTSKKISDLSIKEIRKLRLGDDEKLQKWSQWMVKNFPDVSKNDSLVGVYSPKNAFVLYYNNVYFSSSSDIEFSRSFFSIWLDKKTSEPTLRKKLLNIK